MGLEVIARCDNCDVVIASKPTVEETIADAVSVGCGVVEAPGPVPFGKIWRGTIRCPRCSPLFPQPKRIDDGKED